MKNGAYNARPEGACMGGLGGAVAPILWSSYKSIGKLKKNSITKLPELYTTKFGASPEVNPTRDWLEFWALSSSHIYY